MPVAKKKTTKRVKEIAKRNIKEATENVQKILLKNIDEIGVDNNPGIDVPLHLRGGAWKWNFEKKMSMEDKITWVLTAVNVAILISLVIENV